MNKIYIITQDGRAYSSDGLLHVQERIQESFSEFRPNEQSVFMQGQKYNDVDFIAKCITTDITINDVPFIVGSFPNEIHTWIANEKFANASSRLANPPKDIDELPDWTNSTWTILKYLAENVK